MNYLLGLNPHQRKIDSIILQRYVNTSYISALEAIIRRHLAREDSQAQAESSSSEDSIENEGSKDK